MQKEQKELINKHWHDLLSLTEVQSFAKLLVEKTIFTEQEVQRIFAGLDERENKRQFLKELQNKATAFNILVQWLNSIDQQKLARELAKGSSGITPFKAPIDEQDIVEPTYVLSNRFFDLAVNFDGSTTPLNIKVKLAERFLDSKEHNPHVPFYRTRSENRGKVLIINNYFFDAHTDHKTRTGSEVDEINLTHLFEQMGGWLVQKESNKTAREMKEILKKFAWNHENNRYDICFVFIMSHGSSLADQETIVYGTDGGYLKTQEIHRWFDNSHCRAFRGKPKVFIYQVCRGHELDIPTRHTEYDGRMLGAEGPPPQSPTSTSFPPPRPQLRPVDDTAVGFATMHGSKAHRDPFRGTWYIELICKNIMEYGCKLSVDDILIKVDDDLRRRMSEQGTVQTSERQLRGFNKLYLNPGIYEKNGKLHKFHDS